MPTKNERPSKPAKSRAIPAGKVHTAAYLNSIGVPELPASTSPFDPGYDPITLEGHLEQSSHLMSILKISMACWMIANENATRRKIAAARAHHVPTVTGGGPFEIAVAQGRLPEYLDLCADIGVTRIECGEGFTDMPLRAEDVVAMAHERGLEVQFELGKKHTGAFHEEAIEGLIEQGRRWLDAGAVQLVIEARESARGVGLFDEAGNLSGGFADRFAQAFGLTRCPVRSTQQTEPVRASGPLRSSSAPVQRQARGTPARGDLPARSPFRRLCQSGPAAAPCARHSRPDGVAMQKTFVIDAFPESAGRYRTGYAVVAIDVIRATTTAVTAVALGRRCFPVTSAAEAFLVASTLDQPLLAGELSGDLPGGFEINNSPAEIASRTDVYRPLVLLSSAGTRLIRNCFACDAAYLACFRNYEPVARHLASNHPKVALIGAGTRGEFREEDQMCCAWIASYLAGCGYTPEDVRSAEVMRRWNGEPPAACAQFNSAAYLRRSGQLADLEFILNRIGDLEEVVELRGEEVVRRTAVARGAV